MVKKTKSISINILSVFTILICLLLSSIGITNAWFTSDKEDGVLIMINVGKLQLNLYQNIDGKETKILTDDENLNSANPQFVEVSGPINPDDEIELILTLANDDEGSASMYVRYRFEIYLRGTTSDTPILVNIDGYTKQTTGQSGFAWDSSTEYYYYKDKNGANAPFEKGTSEVIMQSFTIPYSSFINQDGSLKLINSDTIYINLVIEASSSSTFAS